jgi:hypothetical protein
MELRTTFIIPPSGNRITYSDGVVFIGSCFATSIGKQFELGRMPALINPFGTVYNPVSVCNTLDAISEGREYTIDDLYNYQDNWISFNHYTDFSSGDPDALLNKINSTIFKARAFLTRAHFLFVTFGTSSVYRWKLSGKIVSNCHKIPEPEFTREMLSPGEIIAQWSDQLEKLHSINPDLKVIFTISPVRHLKDGAHGNQISKSVLFLAVEELQNHRLKPDYFPAYELIMDDLRDYRFYDADMLHPSALAIDYIWDAFTKCYFDDKTLGLYREVVKITKALSHRIMSDSPGQKKKFAGNMLDRIESVKEKDPSVDLEYEKKYFLDLLNAMF